MPGRDNDWFDPHEVERDDEVVEDILAGTRVMSGYVEQGLAAMHDQVRQAPMPHVSGWIEDPREPSGWRWIENLAAIPDGTPHRIGPSQPYPTPRTWDGWADEDGSVYRRCPADEFEYGGPA